jgi:hypothetical protein
VHRLRALPYDDLLAYIEPHAFEVRARSGRTFQLEIVALWDDRKQQHLRIIAAIDDSRGWRLRDYLRDDFIVSPSGKFVGE